MHQKITEKKTKGKGEKKEKDKGVYLCTDSLNFSSSRNWRMRNTNSLLKEDISDAQIWNNTEIFDLWTPIFRHDNLEKTKNKKKTAQDSNSDNQREIGRLNSKSELKILENLELLEDYLKARSSRISRVWKAADKRRREKERELVSLSSMRSFTGVFLFLLTHQT